jgi:hypothetical protein
MALSDPEKEAVTLVLIEDLRRLYDHVNNNWINLKNRVLTVVFGEVAIVAFIFSDNAQFNLTSFTVAEVIFFFAAIFAMAGSFLTLVWIVSTSAWIIPLELSESRKVYKRYHSKLEYLEYIKEDHEATIESCLRKMDQRSKAFNKVLVALMFGIIVLLVIKFTRPVIGG